MEKKYADGLWNNPRKENQPDFVLANVSFHAERFAKWILENKNEKGFINFQILNGREGAYLKYDDWNLKQNTEPSSMPLGADNLQDTPFNDINYSGEKIMVDDIPF